MSDQLTGFVRCYCGGNNTCVCDDPYEHEHAALAAPPYTRMSGTMADEIRAGIRPKPHMLATYASLERRVADAIADARNSWVEHKGDIDHCLARAAIAAMDGKEGA